MTVYEKLAAVHAAIRQPVKDSLNPHFNSSFASLNECNRVVSEAVRSVGDCDYWQRAVYDKDAGCYEMETVFCADGTEMVLSRHPFRDDANPQKAASASTYARRYSLLSAFNLAAEDDDGNQASIHQDSAKENAKRRMWKAIQRYAELRGEHPNAILDDLRQSSGWSDTAEYFEQKAMEFEEACDV